MIMLNLLLLLLHPSLQKQCTYNPSTFSVTANNPMNPLTNCQEYCSEYYSGIPQRTYYNLTSQDCQPIRFCKYTTNYYNYVTNQCYTDPEFQYLNESYVPETVDEAVDFIGGSGGKGIVCVNGKFVRAYAGGIGICVCGLLWQSSKKRDMNGSPFFCDVVTEHPEQHFFESLKYDNNKKITNYGPFNAQQMQAILSNMHSLQSFQQTQYTLNCTQSILYVLQKQVPLQPLIRPHEYPYLAAVVLLVLVIFGISYWEYQNIRIRVTESKLRKRIMEVLHQQNYLRDG